MTNKQAITVFVFGVAFLLAAFWAGMTVARNSLSSSASSGSKTSTSPAASPRRRDTALSNTGANTGASATTTAARADQDSGASSAYVVRVAAFGTESEADKLAMDLRRKYLSAHTQEPTAGDDSLYRVDIGPYERRDEAEQVAHELGVEGHKGVMIIPR
ncbi:MAG TPA: SPOR domain-containing protein, partial [Blastocatellia bacterium]|nr:SPOR domain-containing protein [Blastocatellia bacterium]